MREVVATVSVDTEEDDWGSYAQSGASCRNIPHLLELHDLLAELGVRPTYLVNRAPLLTPESVEVLGRLAECPETEIGGHCHPWNTPPFTGEGVERSMMFKLPEAANTAKIGEVTRLIRSELGVQPLSFRAGRWAIGPTVSVGLAHHGYRVDASVTPFIDWTDQGGLDTWHAPSRPYRFRPERPFEPDPSGTMVELPTTIGFLGGRHRARAAIRRWLERSPLRHLSAVGVLDVLRVVRRRWLSPETSTARDMVALTDACLRSGEPVLGFTFHSCTLLPGATPFVRSEDDRKRFLGSIVTALRHCAESGVRFTTLSEAGELLFPGMITRRDRAPDTAPPSPTR